MTRPKTLNLQKIAYQRHCFEQLENYLDDREIDLDYQEVLLDLAALADFLEERNFIGASYIGKALLERLQHRVGDWEAKANRYIDKKHKVRDVQLAPEKEQN